MGWQFDTDDHVDVLFPESHFSQFLLGLDEPFAWHFPLIKQYPDWSLLLHTPAEQVSTVHTSPSSQVLDMLPQAQPSGWQCSTALPKLSHFFWPVVHTFALQAVPAQPQVQSVGAFQAQPSVWQCCSHFFTASHLVCPLVHTGALQAVPEQPQVQVLEVFQPHPSGVHSSKILPAL